MTVHLDAEALAPFDLSRKEAVEDHPQMKFQLFCESVDRRSCALAPWDLVAKHPVERFPEDDRSRPVVERLDESLVRAVGIQHEDLPTIRFEHVIQIELASFDPRTFGSLAACYRQLSALRERRGFEAKPELPQFVLFVGLLCAVAHRFRHGVPIHP